MPADSKPAELELSTGVPLSRYLLFFGLAIAGCSVDLLTKHWIFAKLGNSMAGFGKAAPPIWLIDNVFGFETHLNEGALFGIGQGRANLFALLSFAAAIGILVWMFVFRAARDRLLTIALGCVSGGIAGNLYDRLGIPGLTWAVHLGPHRPGDRVYAVRDWLHFKLDSLNFDWPIFNIADCLLVCGATILIVHAIIVREPPPSKERCLPPPP